MSIFSTVKQIKSPRKGRKTIVFLLSTCILSLYLCLFAFGDEVYMKNGNVISGSIIAMNETVIRLETSNGILEIDRQRVLRGSFGNYSSKPKELVFEFLFNKNLEDTATGVYIPENNGAEFERGIDGEEYSALASGGYGNYLVIPAVEELNELNSFTISFWISLEKKDKTRYIISKWNTTSGAKGDGKFALAVGANHIFYYVVDAGGYYKSIKIPNTLPLDEWTHVGVTFGKGKMKIYINGLIKGESLIETEGLYRDESPITVMTAKSSGAANKWSLYNLAGKIDNLRLYSVVLSDEDIEEQYESEKTD